MVERGDRIALVGPNGPGKSTLMRTLAAVDRPDAGERIEGHRVVLDYFAQDQAAVLTPSLTVYEEMASVSPATMIPTIRNILGGFLFSGDDVHKRVSVLSGGERNRLAIAKMLLNPSNVLILDEPTNHLDLDSKEVLLDALADYGGTLVFVSHDRYFVDRLASKVVDVGGGQALPYPGGYEDFLLWKARRAAGADEPVPIRAPLTSSPAPEVRPKPAPSQAPRNRKAKRVARKSESAPAYDPMAPRLSQSKRPRNPQARERAERSRKLRVTTLETSIAEKEKRVKELEALMATPGFFDDRAQADQVVSDHKALMWEVGDLMSQWEALQLELEAG
jgi:ATP-binding cassette subfamily F protein 3